MAISQNFCPWPVTLQPPPFLILPLPLPCIRPCSKTFQMVTVIDFRQPKPLVPQKYSQNKFFFFAQVRQADFKHFHTLVLKLHRMDQRSNEPTDEQSFLLSHKLVNETRPYTRLPQSRAGGQGPYLRSLEHLGRRCEVKESRYEARHKCCLVVKSWLTSS